MNEGVMTNYVAMVEQEQQYAASELMEALLRKQPTVNHALDVWQGAIFKNRRSGYFDEDGATMVARDGYPQNFGEGEV